MLNRTGKTPFQWFFFANRNVSEWFVSCSFKVAVEKRLIPSLQASVVHKQQKNVSLNPKLDAGNMNGKIKVMCILGWCLLLLLIKLSMDLSGKKYQIKI